MGGAAEFWSCDWGTSSFRLRLVEGESLRILAETKADMGVRVLYEQALAAGERQAEGRGRFFASYLREQLDQLRERAESTDQWPLVISGMASSTIGWQEVPYAELPFRLDGSTCRVAPLRWDAPDSVRESFLVSGIASDVDMMRGEETEAIGIMSLPEMADCGDEALLVLPGTHSKHLGIREGEVRDLRTFMTGELFELLSRQSILKASVDLGALGDGQGGREERSAFAEGVEWVRDRGLAGSLFRTRTRAVLNGEPAGGNAWFLSGVLIGAELKEIKPGKGPVILGGSGFLPALYEQALIILTAGRVECRRPAPEMSGIAAVAGQRVILGKLKK